ncbi:MAG: 30S ribosomal protein S3ae [Nitrososphaerota archaeon]|nr:30S ribosomal protein S3ae [Nitrososphaerota archaeon]MDG6966999.1 30S ribosomal protein S3ae [Nitrososphaerota archaeon]MDG6979010.1 30S ribosomal protein S3ae [Nitrososphaerota archaeon]MDG7020453.1 30S ribosomal protein S3ae [Nitrososphaerota archaeon]
MPKKVTGKVRDKWKLKQWVTVLASPSFGNAPIGKVPITDVERPAGRVVETTLYDILKQDPQHYSFKLYFQIDKVDGETAYTILKGHEFSREYLRSLIRRGSSMSDFIKDYKTKDGYVVRVYTIALSQGRMNSSKKHEIRMIVDKIMEERAASLTYDQFVQETVLQKLASDVYNEAKKVTRLRHVGVRKAKLISRPQPGQVEQVEVLAAPAA